MNRRKFIKQSAALSAAFSLPFYSGCRRYYDFDTIIHSGAIYDGISAEPIHADIAIKKGKIAAIGKLQKSSARRLVDASNLVVCPGFIDMHGHSDDDLLIDGCAPSKIHQGVTTEIIGQDGDSMAPLNQAMQEEKSAYYQKKYGIENLWRDFAGYFAVLKERGISMNIRSMVGAGTLRENVIGMGDRPATAAEMQEMRTLLQLALDQGARHISSGLEYTPGSFASTAELAELVGGVGQSGIYATHLRNEDDRLIEAIEEAIIIAEKSGAALHVSHIKVQGERNWPNLPQVLQLLDTARDKGIRTTCDRYPYIAFSTGLTNLFPLWSREGGGEKFLERLRNPGLRLQIRTAVEEKIASLGNWNSVQISSLEKRQAFIGKRLGDLARENGQEPFEFLQQLMLDEGGRGGMVGFGMSEENTVKILQYPYTAIASDGSALAEEGPLAKGNPHPRNFGTFARVLGYYCREKNIFSLAEVIRKMTSLPAGITGIVDRGSIAVDHWADIVIFNPDTVIDHATFSQPKQFSTGFNAVFVNGTQVLENDEHLGTKPGMII